ncbi:MAG: ribonuclease Y [Clostridia bacterium]|nr:ribonuclease Y [Clostridia bacterium]MBQ2738196.1 ribonuclease Y [Clostridia bacterium]MBQ8290050.1 ribonuclease Y [Clostridia bacterium]
MDPIFVILIAIGTLLVGVAFGFIIRRGIAEKKLGSAEEQAKKILEDAIKNAESAKKESVLSAKEEIFKLQKEADADIKDRRREVSVLEKRLNQKEETLDAKLDKLEKKEAALAEKHAKADKLCEDASEALERQMSVLEKLAGLSREEAKVELVARLDSEMQHETAMKIAEYEERFRDEADAKAKDILSLAIQRCAADHVSEIAISVVQIPGDEMKGRIIGREGRNIRTIESLTGVELIVDDTPDVITISGFDPIRREIARIALEKLISDGRIHPARIEEMVEKARREVDAVVKRAGESAVFETGVHGLHPEEIKLLGRMKFRTSFGQNVLRHSVEVSMLAGVIAEELGVDATVAKRAGLLHDIGKALTAEAEGSHIQLGVEVAKKYRESKDVIHAIEAHHNDVEPETVLDFIIQAADAISAARPGARREDVENYIKRLQKLEEVAGDFEGIEKTFAIQAGREVRIMVKPEVVSDDKMKILARDIAKKIEDSLDYPGQIKVSVIRESRTVEFAK